VEDNMDKQVFLEHAKQIFEEIMDDSLKDNDRLEELAYGMELVSSELLTDDVMQRLYKESRHKFRELAGIKIDYDEYYDEVSLPDNTLGYSIEKPIIIGEPFSATAGSMERQIIAKRMAYQNKPWQLKEQNLLKENDKYFDRMVVEFEDKSPEVIYYFDVTIALNSK
jgi:hypothetical protein